MILDIAFSPCPNDTFLFDAWVHKKIASPLIAVPTLADIQQLNSWASQGRFSITKLSAFCFGQNTHLYQLLPVGAVISYVGPKVISASLNSAAELSGKRIAIPGRDTTAYLLFQLLFGSDHEAICCPYEQILPLVASKQVDAGLLIHESRFLLHTADVAEIADLGVEFYQRYNSPLPLGVLAAKQTVDRSLVQLCTEAIQSSLIYANNHPSSSMPYILQNAQEKEPQIVMNHINAYVTDETMAISKTGIRALQTLFELAIVHGLLPPQAGDFI